ncbi:MAG: pyridoxine 5'-phosphate synthase [Gemmatimonadales bacterium]|nr:pyridoxine 5'-phosphate synthase [Gemmatimonadales bacterium]NIN12362.1 pyridoxine 5'-phosphate synthase [Gemmatimonadales bacterium]NIN48900.1 pyridoxine 5'-phosphate synthase [Gemmatimonadales bacterium]NIP06364.1 pyridoxine 5'-phosphate synthase [Gemmatimonadales bacterium]NIR00737.1 pyridoxine 5'-phosphate synthase [Gemmatimonadales bacterium]
MRLYINVDHVATVRQARRTDEPDPVEAAAACERAGADGITAHLREDRRHIQDDDMRRLAATVTTVLNLELATADDIVQLATELRPFQATLVPERREEVTTEGGLNLGPAGAPPDPRLVESIGRLSNAGIRVSLFIDPDAATIDRAAELGVPAIELHTGEYAHTYRDSNAALDRLAAAVRHARAVGLAVHAGHGLTYRNVTAVAAIRDIEELNIGHSVVSRSIMVGMETAVREMRALVDAARVDPR